MSLVSAMAGLSVGSGSAFLAGSPLQQRRPLRVFTPLSCPQIEAAHKKGAGSTKNGRDSNSKRRGVKVYGGQPIGAGGIIVRQLGTHVRSSWEPPPEVDHIGVRMRDSRDRACECRCKWAE